MPLALVQTGCSLSEADAPLPSGLGIMFFYRSVADAMVVMASAGLVDGRLRLRWIRRGGDGERFTGSTASLCLLAIITVAFRNVAVDALVPPPYTGSKSDCGWRISRQFSALRAGAKGGARLNL